MWKALSRALIFSLAALSAPAAAAQTTTPLRAEAPSSVTGRVTDGERGLPGLTVAIFSTGPESRNRPVARARTDAEGQYRLTGVPPGRYVVAPSAPTYVMRDVMGFPPGKQLTLAAGETVDGVDFRLERGGVITGRVTDADGNPIVGETIQLTPAEVDPRTPSPGFRFDPREMQTDDRGVYRIYGLAPGRYKVSVGRGEETGSMRVGLVRKLYRRTYHPDVEEAGEARVVEVRSGGEAGDVDIKVARTLKTYKVAGRFVNAETGEPVPGVSYGFSVMSREGRSRGFGAFSGGMPAGARGEFEADGLSPGRYTVVVTNQDGSSEMVADPTPFEVVDADVSNIVVRLRRGASLSGVVQFEGAVDRATAAKLIEQLRVYIDMDQRGQGGVIPAFMRPLPLAPDGSFTFRGLTPGRYRVGVTGSVGNRFTFLRAELNGALIREGVEVRDGMHVTGVRVVIAYGQAVIRGQVNVTGGTLPTTGRVMALARRMSGGEEGTGGGARAAEVDSRGRFLIENLAPGDYEVRVSVYGAGRPLVSEPQRVTVSGDSELQVTLTLDMNAQPGRGVRP
ncbi:MAG TPA: carboxypeptidase regulatory-like domain-containing protein [Pyrinomonadaceae bacterium]|nr:carboxypeptidase regulatory-like domain-containing protein [Pyrinomonadaceae bacterium]